MATPLRKSLFRKYAAIFVALVGGVLVTEGVVEMAFDYDASRRDAAALQRAEARAAADRIGQFLQSIERQLVDVSGLPWSAGLLGLTERRLEYQRILKLVPAITEVRGVDAGGRERLRVSRSELDEVDSGRDVAGLDAFVKSRPRQPYYSPAFFREGSVPHLTLAVRDAGRGGAVTLAELNLKFVGDVVGDIRVGRGGFVYAVDGQDNLVAHPDLSLVVRRPDLSAYTPLKRIRAQVAQGGETVVGMFEGRGLEGGDVLISAALIPATQWLVVAEQPRREVLQAMYDSLTRTLTVMGIGLLVALVSGYVLARRLAQPILEVQRGAEKIAGGNFSTRIGIRTGDEVEALAREFNRMADQLQGYTTGLEQRVAEKTAELEMANRHKSEFLANMSHELRTPLNAVIGFSDVLREEMFGPLNAKQLEYVADIHLSGQHLLSLINDILDLSKVEAGRMQLDVHPFDVRAAVENCATLIRERALRGRLRFSCEAGRGTDSWRGDERKFKQVVINLLSNAVKFTPPGGEVALQAGVEDGALVLRVRDTGIGIDPEDQQAIFEEFRQARMSSRRAEGTGLGLALSRRLVELHGGTLTVESRPGQGSVFTARFPLLPADA
ncbi:MAG TPA: sensor histidine kinase [Usitatibacter sp.]|jgi:signal transduction histidine kinase|nr:sensor histidine kinase [Usitatibacter sp.]